MLMAPISILSNHNRQLSGTVLAKAPRNCTIITWNMTVETKTAEKIQLLNIPWNTLIFSICRLFISLKTWSNKNQFRNNLICNDQIIWWRKTNKQDDHKFFTATIKQKINLNWKFIKDFENMVKIPSCALWDPTLVLLHAVNMHRAYLIIH